MNRRVIFPAAALLAAFPATPLFPCSLFHLQDSASSQPQASPSKTSEPVSEPATPTHPEPKKTKKVWTNDNLGDVSGSAISQMGDAKDSSPRSSTAAKPASSQVVAAFRKQLTALQAQLAGVDKQIATLQSFSKGEIPGANGLQLHKAYSTEPVDDQVRKLEEKKKSLAAQMDSVFDAARKRGVEPGQLR
jgi:hypothetical protein